MHITMKLQYNNVCRYNNNHYTTMTIILLLCHINNQVCILYFNFNIVQQGLCSVLV